MSDASVTLPAIDAEAIVMAARIKAGWIEAPAEEAADAKAQARLAAEAAEAALEALRGHPLGKDAAIIGRVTAEHPGLLVAKTAIGGHRVVPLQMGEQLPRIC